MKFYVTCECLLETALENVPGLDVTRDDNDSNSDIKRANTLYEDNTRSAVLIKEIS